MCDPTGIAVGAAIGAATSAATGQDPLMGAVLGGVTGGFSPGSVGVTPGLDMFATTGFNIGTGAATVGISYSGLATAAAVGLAGGYLKGALIPQQQDYSQYYQQTAFDPIAYNTQQSVVTGSGGRQASANLAEEIKRAKNRRAAQADVGDIDLATSLSNTGLQIA